MFVALGIGAYDTALFHVVTHAFFKALLFLCAGSVIHAMSNEQDIRNMGGLRKKLPVTHATFLIGTLAIVGMPPFSGFFSKDEILAKAYEHSFLMFVVLAITSVITATYMFRLYYLTFFGDFRGSEQQRTHLHESPAVMTIPLMVLAVLATFGGFLGIPEIFHAPHYLSEFLKNIVGYNSNHVTPSESFEWKLVITSIIGLMVIIILARNYYISKKTVPEADGVEQGFMPRLVSNKYYIDELYASVITKPLDKISAFSFKNIETGFIDRAVNNLGTVLNSTSSLLKNIQSGNIGFYIFSMVIGIILILLFNLVM